MRTLHRAPPRRLDGGADRLRRGRGRHLHHRRHPVQPAGPAARPRAARSRRRTTGCGSSPAPTGTSRSRRRPGCSGSGTTPWSPVPSTRSRRMDPAALGRGARGHAWPTGGVPMAVVATAGTTDFGAIDPLPEVAGAAPGRTAPGSTSTPPTGAGCWSRPRRRDWLDGIELADSVAVDYHKTWFQPVSCSALLVRDGSTLRTRHLACRLPQPAGLRPPQPGRQEPADDPPLRGAEALAHAAGDGRGRDRGPPRHRHRPHRRGGAPSSPSMPDIDVAARPAAEHDRVPLPPGRATTRTALDPAQRGRPGRALRRGTRAGRRHQASTAAATSSSPCSTRWPRSTTSWAWSRPGARGGGAIAGRDPGAPTAGRRLAVAR